MNGPASCVGRSMSARGIPSARLRRAGPGQPGAIRGQPATAQAGMDRKRGTGERRAGRQANEPAQGARGELFDGRLRHRLIQTVLSQTAATGSVEDRHVVRPRHRHGSKQRSRRPGHPCHESITRTGGHRRRDRDRGAAALPARERLPPLSGLSARETQADRGMRNAPRPRSERGKGDAGRL